MIKKIDIKKNDLLSFLPDDILKKMSDFVLQYPDRIKEWKRLDEEKQRDWDRWKKIGIDNNKRIKIWQHYKNYINSVVGICPSCGDDLVIRYGRKTGKKFIGCSGYPECEYVDKI